jgi:hypothetical protein
VTFEAPFLNKTLIIGSRYESQASFHLFRKQVRANS